MSKLTVAQLLVETLASAGVRNIYGLPGDSLNGITDSIRTHPDLHWVHVRHEETAAFAAGAEAHLTGKVAVCAGSCGPGNLHLINGLYDCYRSRVPVVAIAAQIPSAEIGSGYFQETDPQHIFAQCSDYCGSVTEPEQMPRVLEIALQTAIAKRTVAVVTIPGDVALKPAVAKAPSVRLNTPNPVVRPADDELAALAKLLNENERITILAGAGCAGAHDELVTLASKLQSPVVHAMRGKEFVEYDNPFDVGMTGLIGFSSGYYAMVDCDLLLMLGTDFPYRQFYPERAKIVQIDIRGEQLGRRTKLDLGLVGNVKHTIEALLPLIQTKYSRERLEAAIEHYKRARKGLDDLASPRTLSGKMHPQYVACLIDELAAEDAIFTCDVGAPTVWAARYLKMNGKRRLLGSFNHGSMANAMPQAIGAQASHPGRQVVSFSGDGGFAMLMGDLLTLRQLNLPVKVVVFNNDALAFVELEMKASGFVEFGTDLKNPDFAKLAEAAGIAGFSAETPEQAQAALSEAFRHDGPALVSVSVARQELSMPPTITIEEAKGFALFMVKAVLDGRVGELVDLAATNLWH